MKERTLGNCFGNHSLSVDMHMAQMRHNPIFLYAAVYVTAGPGYLTYCSQLSGLQNSYS